jgi:hypothetical protein
MFDYERFHDAPTVPIPTQSECDIDLGMLLILGGAHTPGGRILLAHLGASFCVPVIFVTRKMIDF